MKKTLFVSITAILFSAVLSAQEKSLHQIQQEFEDLKFGLFTHFGIPTYMEADWSDPDQSPEILDAPKLDCQQWAKAAKSAKMTYGVLSVKHHNGLCLWDTGTTDYNIMNSKFGRDLVKEYTEAFGKAGLKVIFHFSILDTHNRLRANRITKDHIEMTKQQLRELLTNYGPVTAVMFDGWDAPWGRISYEDVPFWEISTMIKSIQPECLVMDMNSHKYPREALFYGDIKFYEQGAGQKISTTENTLPAMACLPIQRTWFWKESMPTDTLLDPEMIVRDILNEYPKAHCSFVLNAAPNRDGLIDDNALKALAKIGKLWKGDKETYELPECEAPVVQRNIALNRPCESSWSEDMNIMDLANDDDFYWAWVSSPTVKEPWWMVELDGERDFNMIVLTEQQAGAIRSYRLEYRHNGTWNTLFDGAAPGSTRVHEHRFDTVQGDKVRIVITSYDGLAKISEFGVYQPL